MPAPQARRGGLPAALVVLAALLPYLNAFGHDFVRDDEVIIRDNLGLRSLPALWDALRSNYWGAAAADGEWRPVALLSWAFNYALGGLDTFGYTALDLVIHAGVCLLLLRLARALGASPAAATAAALLFAVHPVHVEAVTGFVGRADTLASLLVLATLLAHRRAARGGPGAGRRRALAALCLALALATKENAFALLALLPAMDWLAPADDAQGRPAGLRRRWRSDYLTYAAVALLYLGARWSVLGALGPDVSAVMPAFNPLVPARLTPLGELRGATPVQSLLTPFALVAEAARLLLWPAHLSMDYSFAQLALASSLLDARVLVGLLLTAAALVAVFAGRRRWPALAFAAAFTVLAWLPTSNLRPIGTLFGERLLYLPSAGALLALGLLWERAAARRPAPGLRLPLLALLAAALLACAARTWERNRAWANLDTVTAAMVQDAPGSFLSHAARGSHLHVLAGRERSPAAAAALREQALAELRASLAICPEYEQANRAFIAACWAAGDPAATLPAYERLARISPRDARVHQGWAMALLELAPTRGEQAGAARAEARLHLDRALALDPRDTDALFARGLLLCELPAERSQALSDLRAVLRLAPQHPERAQIEAALRALEAQPAGG